MRPFQGDQRLKPNGPIQVEVIPLGPSDRQLQVRFLLTKQQNKLLSTNKESITVCGKGNEPFKQLSFPYTTELSLRAGFKYSTILE